MPRGCHRTLWKAETAELYACCDYGGLQLRQLRMLLDILRLAVPASVDVVLAATSVSPVLEPLLLRSWVYYCWLGVLERNTPYHLLLSYAETYRTLIPFITSQTSSGTDSQCFKL